MKRNECIAITRIISNLIKADAIIDVGEMDMYVRLKEKWIKIVRTGKTNY